MTVGGGLRLGISSRENGLWFIFFFEEGGLQWKAQRANKSLTGMKFDTAHRACQERNNSLEPFNYLRNVSVQVPKVKVCNTVLIDS